jgi:hypothetical protein
MKLDPGIHIGMHLVCFSKTRCDKEGAQLHSVIFSNIRRAQNKAAHKLAQLALCSGDGRVSAGADIPACIVPVLNSDSPK